MRAIILAVLLAGTNLAAQAQPQPQPQTEPLKPKYDFTLPQEAKDQISRKRRPSRNFRKSHRLHPRKNRLPKSPRRLQRLHLFRRPPSPRKPRTHLLRRRRQRHHLPNPPVRRRPARPRQIRRRNHRRPNRRLPIRKIPRPPKARHRLHDVRPRLPANPQRKQNSPNPPAPNVLRPLRHRKRHRHPASSSQHAPHNSPRPARCLHHRDPRLARGACGTLA